MGIASVIWISLKLLLSSGYATKHLRTVKEPRRENAMGKDGGGGHHWQVHEYKVDKVDLGMGFVRAKFYQIMFFSPRREKCNIKAISEEKYAESVCKGPTVNYMSAAVKFRFKATIEMPKIVWNMRRRKTNVLDTQKKTIFFTALTSSWVLRKLRQRWQLSSGWFPQHFLCITSSVLHAE